MLELIKIGDQKWNQIVKSFDNYDTYYTEEYSESMNLIEKCNVFLIHFKYEDYELCYPVFEKDIALFPSFENKLEAGKYFDWNTPYGYGGPLINKPFPENVQKVFYDELSRTAKSRNIVTQFIRFHPIIQNQDYCKDVISTSYIKDTIYIDLSTNDDLFVQMDSKNRNLIRKAMKNDVVIKHDKGNYLKEFIDIYNTTMDRDNATDFYYFPVEYYKYLIDNMRDNIEFFYAFKNGVIVASSIFFCENGQMHYHLSGNLLEYRQFAPTNLLLYEAANWGRENGLKTLHLGGGLGSEDSLFHFKKQFNKDGRIGFYLGKNIFNEDTYDYLLAFRKKLDSQFDINNGYFIQYRLPKNY